MSKSKNRRARRTRRYEPAVTPTHFIRIVRLPTRLDGSLSWFAVRWRDWRDCRRGEDQLRAAGAQTWRPLEPRVVVRRGRSATVETSPLPGWVFAGFPEAERGRSELIRCRYAGEDRRPSLAFLGPFTGLQAFADRLAGELVAVLWSGDRVVAVLPAVAAGIAEGETVRLAPPMREAA